MNRSGRPLSPATLFFALLSLTLAIALYVKTRPRPTERVASPARESPSRAPARPRPPSSAPMTTGPAARESRSARGTAPPLESASPKIAIVIDDLGNDAAAIERVARWPFPVTGAVLPELPGSASSARALAASGKQVLLHLPMEPNGYPTVRPGPGVVLISQSDEEIDRILESDLASVPGAAGVNNHMGSAATADPRVMRRVAGVLSRRGLFFVDSRTTGRTVARSIAEEAQVPSASRRVFLDDTPTPRAIESSLAELVRNARAEGSAIAIGHPYAATLSVLERELPRIQSEGIRLVKVGELVR